MIDSNCVIINKQQAAKILSSKPAKAIFSADQYPSNQLIRTAARILDTAKTKPRKPYWTLLKPK